MLHLKHKLLVVLPRTGRNGAQWHLALHWFPRSSVLLWPCELVPVAGKNFQVVELHKGLRRPVVAPVSTMQAGSRAMVFEWRSWLWQLRTLPDGAAAWQPE